MRHLMRSVFFFFFNDTATTEIYTLSLHDALPIWSTRRPPRLPAASRWGGRGLASVRLAFLPAQHELMRSEEHTSELQSRPHLVCRLLLEKKKKNRRIPMSTASSQAVSRSISSVAC